MRSFVWAVLVAFAATGTARADQGLAPASPAAGTTVTGTLGALTRLESWSFFPPPPDGGDPQSTFLGNRLNLGVHVVGPRWEAHGVLQYIQLWGLPTDAFGPGILGTGGEYAWRAGQSTAYQLYPRLLTFTWKSPARGTTVSFGRMNHASGGEMASGVASLDFLKRARLEGRLLGNGQWSIIERAFDGVRVDVDRPAWHAAGALLLPTQGVFEESATPTIGGIQVATASIGVRPHVLLPWSELQAFGVVYRDRRSVTVRPDNRRLRATAADVTIATLGVSQAGIFPTNFGEADSIVWLAAQVGDWYGEPHRGVSAAAEIGHRFTAARGRPWVRAGLFYASGDDDPDDGRHTTFFSVLPDTRHYTPVMTHALMNVRELFAHASIEPSARVTLGVDVRRVDLATSGDRWYTGSGATAARGDDFGYFSRPSLGATGLGRTVEATADVRLWRRWSVNAFLGLMWGGDVVTRQFADGDLRYFYLEQRVRF